MTDERCDVTKNLCGTDTWMVGHPCQCKSCREYLSRPLAREELAELVRTSPPPQSWYEEELPC